MTTAVRILEPLLVLVRKDLERPHHFAAERVGFLYARRAPTSGGIVLLASGYEPVQDDHYVDDPAVGARIGSAAIRSALQHALSSGDCVLHVHAHFGSLAPSFSRVDLEGLEGLIPSFFSVAPRAAHGGLVLGDIHAYGLVWASPRANPSTVAMRYVGRSVALLGGLDE